MGVAAMRQFIFRNTLGAIAASVMAIALAAPLVPAAMAASTSATPAATPADLAPASPIWQQVRQVLFGTRPIAVASDEVLTLETPYRAEDAATVPIALRSRLSQ